MILIRTRYDQFGKLLIRVALARRGSIESDAEVPAEPRRIDLRFTPDRGTGEVPEHLGLLGRITAGPSTVELFHDTPGGHDLADCVTKHGQLLHHIALHEPSAPAPLQWVISSGRPISGIEGLWLRPLADWPSGIYEGPPLLSTRLVVVSELPNTPATLLLRLLGAGRVLKQAIAELKDLPEHAPERLLALPILVGLRLEVPADLTKQTKDDQEFLMDTHDIVEHWRQEAVQEGVQRGVQEGVQQGERKALLRLLRHRFGAEVDAHIEQRVAAAPIERIEAWTLRVLSAATLAELFAD